MVRWSYVHHPRYWSLIAAKKVIKQSVSLSLDKYRHTFCIVVSGSDSVSGFSCERRTLLRNKSEVH